MTAFSIRPYRAADRAAFYAVCLATGRDGEDASELFQDPMLLGHRYVGPYLDLEPRLAFALRDGDGVCGYVLGAADTADFNSRFLRDWLPEVVADLPRPDGDPGGWNEEERLLAELHAPTIILPSDGAAYPAHLHIDLLPRAQGQGQGRRMIERLFAALVEGGSPGVHLVVGARNHRAQGFYRTLGFEAIPVERSVEGALAMGRRLP